MGTSLKSEYNKEDCIELNLIFDKACYYPGEKIYCTLTINPKPNLKNTLFNETFAIIKLVQMQKYTYQTGSGKNRHTVTVKEDTDLVNENFDFIYFKGANILTGLNIPFSITIPLEIQPSVFIRTYFIKHFIAIDLPGLNSKRALMIIIKSFRKFTFKNKLLKMPAIGLGDFYKKKKDKYMGGKLSCLLKLPKNSYYFFDIISFELYLDCSELNMDIASAKVILNKSVYKMNKKYKRTHFQTISNDNLIVKEYTLNKSLERYEIKDFLQLNENNEFFENIYPQQIYSNFDNLKHIELDYNFNKIKMTPFCFGGLLSVEFKIKVEVEYKMNRRKSSFELPIQFHDNYSINELNENINSEYKQDKNNDKEMKNNSQEIDDFVIIENEDIEKIYFGKSK